MWLTVSPQTKMNRLWDTLWFLYTMKKRKGCQLSWNYVFVYLELFYFKLLEKAYLDSIKHFYSLSYVYIHEKENISKMGMVFLKLPHIWSLTLSFVFFLTQSTVRFST